MRGEICIDALYGGGSLAEWTWLFLEGSCWVLCCAAKHKAGCSCYPLLKAAGDKNCNDISERYSSRWICPHIEMAKLGCDLTMHNSLNVLGLADAFKCFGPFQQQRPVRRNGQ